MEGLISFMPAGGLGTRMRPYTLNTPKPLLLMGRPDRRVIDASLELSARVSEHVWVSVDYLGEQVVDYVGSKDVGSIGTLTDTRTSGSAGSLVERQDRMSIGDSKDLLVLPSDHIYDGNFSIENYIKTHRELDADITLMTVPHKECGQYATIDEQGFVQSIDTSPSPNNVSTTGTYIFKGSFVANFLHSVRRAGSEELNIYKDIVCSSIGKAVVATYFVDYNQGYWEDTGTLRRFFSSNMRLSSGDNVVDTRANIGSEVILKRCVVLGDVALQGAAYYSDAIIGTVFNHGPTIVTRFGDFKS